MNDLRIMVQLSDVPGFSADRDYHVLDREGTRFLLVDEDARLRWIETDAVTPVTVDHGTDRLFDLELHRNRRKLEDLVGKPVVFTTWEHIGFDPDEMTTENMYVYRGVVENYDGETLFLVRPDDPDGRFGILPRAIATIDEDPSGES